MGGRFGSIQARSVKRTHKWVCHVVPAYPNVSLGPMNGSILLRWASSLLRLERANPPAFFMTHELIVILHLHRVGRRLPDAKGGVAMAGGLSLAPVNQLR